jgi:hypothetical protein
MLLTRRDLQDPTCHPTWTGKKVSDIDEESRAAKFIARYERRRLRMPKPAVQDSGDS